MSKSSLGVESWADIALLIKYRLSKIPNDGLGCPHTLPLRKEFKERGAYGVYAIVCHSSPAYVKIGKAHDVKQRIGDLQVGCPFILSLWGIAATGDERTHHRALYSEKVSGEWFKASEITLGHLALYFLYYDPKSGSTVDLDTGFREFKRASYIPEDKRVVYKGRVVHVDDYLNSI